MKKQSFVLILAIFITLWSATWALADDTLPSVDEAHLLLSYGNNSLQALEFMAINNQSSKPFDGGNITDPNGKPRVGWLIPLPQGFQNLQIQGWNKTDYAVVKEGIQIYKALNAKTVTQLSFSYDLPVSGLPAEISKKFGFMTKQFSVVVPVNSLSVKTNNTLQDAGVVSVNNQSYEQYYAANILAGTELSLTVNQANSSAAKGTNRVSAGYNVKLHPQGHVQLFSSEPLVYTNPHIWAAYLFVMIGLAIAALIIWYKSRFDLREVSDNDGEDDDEQLFLKLKNKQDLLLQRIKTLDIQFKTGEINENEYQTTRENLKELLVRVKLQLRELA